MPPSIWWMFARRWIVMASSDDKELLKFLEPYPPESREVALALRAWVWKLYPRCNELIYDNYNFLAFGWAPTTKRGDIFCNVAVGTRGVMFGFMRGNELDDPDGLLGGSGSRFRSIRVPTIKGFPKVYARYLIKQAFALSISSLKGRPETPNALTIVKSISEKKRRPGMATRAPSVRREKHPMPDDILGALESDCLFEAYECRPPYQQNDYIGWIVSAKRDETRQKRITQMLDELRRGDVYLTMKYKPAGKL